MISLRIWRREWNPFQEKDHDEVEKERFLSDEQPGGLRLQDRQRFRGFQSLLYLIIVNLLPFSASLLLVGFSLLPRNANKNNAATKETSFYSPVIETMEIKYHEVHLNGTFWPPANPPFSRLEPGPDADEAWGVFERQAPDVFAITREDVIALGKDPETVARFPDEDWGMGAGGYVASLDVLHKLHCLNEVRKMTFEDYGEKKPRKKTHGDLWWIHLRHCVDMLAQDIMCHADADVLTYNWMDTQEHPFVDFSINRRCRKFDDLLSWKEDRKVDMDRYWKMEKPAGVRQVPAEGEYYATYGFEGSDLFPRGVGYVPTKAEI